MDAQAQQEALRFILNGLRHSGSASSCELATRLASLTESREEAQEVIAEAERIGLTLNPTLPERPWRLAAGLDIHRLGIPAWAPTQCLAPLLPRVAHAHA